MFKKGTVLTLEDNNEYSIVDQYNDNGTMYIYLVDINNNSNVIFGKLENDEIVELNNPEELEKVMKTINERVHKDEKLEI